MRRVVYFWRDLSPLVREFLRESGLPFNRFVNLAVQSFLDVSNVEELRLKAKLCGLLRREVELRRVSNAMLRSGAFLEGYAAKTLGKPVGKPKPLSALNGREALVFRKICSERERVANEIASVMEKLLEKVEPYCVDEHESFRDYVEHKKHEREVKTENE